jgi:arginyl-tRNA synthetase
MKKATPFFYLNENFGLDEEGKTRMATVLRADGTSLYITQDLGLAAKRNDEYKLNELIYVVGSEQKFHFQVLFEILKTLGYSWADKLFHLAYGMVYLPEGKMKSREGTVVDADDLLKQLESLAVEEIKKRDEKKQISEAELAKRSRMIALAAIKFYFLCNRPTTDIYFNPKESIAFEGFTGPYLQYTHARIYGILRKAGELSFKARAENLDLTEQEAAVLRKLHQFPEILENASQGRLPSVLCKYLFEVAQSFNTFYQAVPVLSEEDADLKNFRKSLKSIS